MTVAARDGFCECGCGQRTGRIRYDDPKSGARVGDYRRVIQGHATAKVPVGVEWREDEQGCWIWQRPLSPKGYGVKWDGKSRRHAHRVIYEREVGPIPVGMHLHHLCGNKACVNPDHLQPVTNGEHGGGKEVRAIRCLAQYVEVDLLAQAFEITEDRVKAILDFDPAITTR